MIRLPEGRFHLPTGAIRIGQHVHVDATSARLNVELWKLLVSRSTSRLLVSSLARRIQQSKSEDSRVVWEALEALDLLTSV